MKWFVRLKGDRVDLEELSVSLNFPALNVAQEGETFILKSTDFDCLNSPDNVQKRAREILPLINGGAKLTLGMREPLQVAEVVKINDDGTHNIFVYLSDQVSVRAIANVLYIAENGTVKEIRQSDAIPSWLLAAERDNNVAKVLRLFGAGGSDWISLYKIYEIIEVDVGNASNIEKKGWATKKAIKRFKHTANSPGILGDDSRHGIERTKPPKDPMLLTEAKSLVEGITKNWLRSKT